MITLPTGGIREANKARLLTGHKLLSCFFIHPPFAPVGALGRSADDLSRRHTMGIVPVGTAGDIGDHDMTGRVLRRRFPRTVSVAPCR